MNQLDEIVARVDRWVAIINWISWGFAFFVLLVLLDAFLKRELKSIFLAAVFLAMGGVVFFVRQQVKTSAISARENFREIRSALEQSGFRIQGSLQDFKEIYAGEQAYRIFVWADGVSFHSDRSGVEAVLVNPAVPYFRKMSVGTNYVTFLMRDASVMRSLVDANILAYSKSRPGVMAGTVGIWKAEAYRSPETPDLMVYGRGPSLSASQVEEVARLWRGIAAASLPEPVLEVVRGRVLVTLPRESDLGRHLSSYIERVGSAYR